MRLYQIRIRPTSPWRTPWQADTLAGLLCWTCARVRGEETLRRRILEPALAGLPPFLLSDVFPGDLLPLPAAVRLAPWPPEQHKRLKHGSWLPRADFIRVQQGQMPDPSAVLSDSAALRLQPRTHNTLARDSNTTGDEGSLFSSHDVYLPPTGTPARPPSLSLFFRVQPDAADLLMELLAELALTGFGADIATGRGQFSLDGTPEPDEDLDRPHPEADAVTALSTFQPGADDPVDGYWQSFTKYGKLGPGFGLDNPDVRKHPMIMFCPGACFAPAPRPFLGRAIPMDEFLSPPVAGALRARHAEVIHWAYALTVLAKLHLAREFAHA